MGTSELLFLDTLRHPDAASGEIDRTFEVAVYPLRGNDPTPAGWERYSIPGR
ncbi:MAG: hypothetical protein ACP5D7_15935 [Limnospira sp.]